MRRFPRPPRIRGTPQFVPIEGVRTPQGNSGASSRGAGGARAYPSASSANGHCASPSAPAPIKNRNKEVRFEIAAATRSGTTSSSAANARLLKGLIAFNVVGTPVNDSAAFLLWIAAVHVLFQQRLRVTLRPKLVRSSPRLEAPLQINPAMKPAAVGNVLMASPSWLRHQYPFA